MHSDQMRLEAEGTVRAAIEAVRSANLNPEAQYTVLTVLLTAEVTALLERSAREALEQYVMPALVAGDETELSPDEEPGPSPIKLSNANGEGPNLDIGTDPDGSLVFSPPQGQ